ncbi:YihY/virulence factor BrkB family protein [Nocardioides sp. TRM66260-LWL]|uniref:YihY/virulence factor BrkB family protein n=1 Tax=Nocardioides sp. TRM66260-LWL TaxID=2874478 RepID=UPI001CC45173|nr:YihY/virulence factor BrkB family protein [Nocardioides sp. TRM66260-LWL]MBZ5736005.1 YihY/virulence factor BrkB family protein [Nocardioides sp. TRM66260-LWL]
MGRLVDAADRTQQRVPVIGMPLAVVYKFADDQGTYLAAIISYYAFIAIFPLLLLASTILGVVLQGYPDLQQQVLNSALSQFPIIGDKLGRPEELQGSLAAVIAGSVAALYGSLGLGQAIQNAVNVAWSVPRNNRPNPIVLRLKSLLLLLSAGVAVLGVSIASALASGTQVFGPSFDAEMQWIVRLGTVALLWLVLTLLFRLAAARSHTIGTAAPGALAVAIMWQGLQTLGTVYATRVLAETDTMTGTFGLVLGLVGIIYLAALMGVLGMEVNVVLARRLWPRALLTPFTDNVRLTEADRRAYQGYVRSQRHKGFETIEITWDDLPVVEEPLAEDPAAPTRLEEYRSRLRRRSGE